MVLDLTGIQALKLKRQHIRHRSRGPARGGWAQDWPLVAYICFQGLVSSGGIPEPLHVCLLRGILSLLWSLGDWPEPLSILAWPRPPPQIAASRAGKTPTPRRRRRHKAARQRCAGRTPLTRNKREAAHRLQGRPLGAQIKWKIPPWTNSQCKGPNLMTQLHSEWSETQQQGKGGKG